MHRLHVATFDTDSDINTTNCLDTSLLIPSPFTVHTFTICRSFHLGLIKQFAYCPSGSGHSALLEPSLVYFNNINCAASMDMNL